MPGPESIFSSDELLRYSRQLNLPGYDLEHQKKLKAASVLVVGAGGLGSPVSMYLAAAGIGRLGLIDFDVVETSNLHRQILHGTGDVGRPKTESARDRLHDLNPHVKVEIHTTRLTAENALEILGAYDVVADGTDNFSTRYLVNDTSVRLGKPNVYASIFQFEGQVSVFGLPDGPCYRCIYPVPPAPGLIPSCAEGGVLGVLPGMVGALQATEVIKLITGLGTSLSGRLLLYDALHLRVQLLHLDKNPACPVCGRHPEQHETENYAMYCTGEPATAPNLLDRKHMIVQELKARLDRNESVVLLDVRKPFEREIADLGGISIPLDELEDRMDELSEYRDREIVVYCRSGARSARAVSMLQQAGFDHARNLEGGVLAWSDHIDPSMLKY